MHERALSTFPQQSEPQIECLLRSLEKKTLTLQSTLSFCSENPQLFLRSVFVRGIVSSPQRSCPIFLFVTFVYLQITEITSVDDEKPVKFSQEVGFSVEKYEIV